MQFIFISDLLPKSSTPERPSNQSSEATDPRLLAFEYVLKFYQDLIALSDDKDSLNDFLENRQVINFSMKDELLEAYSKHIKNIEDLIKKIVSLFLLSDTEIICYTDENLIKDELDSINKKYESLVEVFDQTLINLRGFS